jgi:hypothetical protein
VAVGIVRVCVFIAVTATFRDVYYLEHSVVYIYIYCVEVTENSCVFNLLANNCL